MSETSAIVGTRLDYDEVFEPQGYDFKRPQKWWGWLPAALWGVLARLGAVVPHMGTVKVWRIERVHKEPKLLETLMPLVEEWVYRRGRGDDYVIVMGEIDFMEFVHSADFRGPGGPFQITAKPFGYRGEVFGVPVHVVQSISGVALMPRVVVEKSK